MDARFRRHDEGRFSLSGDWYGQPRISMATMNVSLPDPMKDWVESQARTGRYSNASDYVRDLIRRDQERAARHEEMQKLITEGVESGISTRPMEDILRAARARAAGKPDDGI
ncbi:MAG TPA: type II toxin-antitoxin system ParD family antitoxin [Acetobacteraceae bacterium]